jgi:hypothetical protein
MSNVFDDIFGAIGNEWSDVNRTVKETTDPEKISGATMADIIYGAAAFTGVGALGAGLAAGTMGGAGAAGAIAAAPQAVGAGIGGAAQGAIAASSAETPVADTVSLTSSNPQEKQSTATIGAIGGGEIAAAGGGATLATLAAPSAATVGAASTAPDVISGTDAPIAGGAEAVSQPTQATMQGFLTPQQLSAAAQGFKTPEELAAGNNLAAIGKAAQGGEQAVVQQQQQQQARTAELNALAAEPLPAGASTIQPLPELQPISHQVQLQPLQHRPLSHAIFGQEPQ